MDIEKKPTDHQRSNVLVSSLDDEGLRSENQETEKDP